MDDASRLLLMLHVDNADVISDVIGDDDVFDQTVPMMARQLQSTLRLQVRSHTCMAYT